MLECGKRISLKKALKFTIIIFLNFLQNINYTKRASKIKGFIMIIEFINTP